MHRLAGAFQDPRVLVVMTMTPLVEVPP